MEHEDEAIPDAPEGNGQTTTAPAVAEEWDVSLCFKTAAACGVSPDLYDRYLQAVYGAPGSDVPDAAVAKEAARLRAAATEGERLALKAEMIRDLNNALKQKGK